MRSGSGEWRAGSANGGLQGVEVGVAGADGYDDLEVVSVQALQGTNDREGGVVRVGATQGDQDLAGAFGGLAPRF